MMIETTQVTSIDSDSLDKWLCAYLKGHVADEIVAYIIPREWEAKGESRFFSSIDVDKPLSRTQLLERMAKEYSRGHCMYFYADDVVAAAVGAGQLTDCYYHLYYTW